MVQITPKSVGKQYAIIATAVINKDDDNEYTVDLRRALQPLQDDDVVTCTGVIGHTHITVLGRDYWINRHNLKEL